MLSPGSYLFLRWYLWIAPNLLLLPCLYGLSRRRIYRTFPLFAVYVAAQLTLFAIGLLTVLTLSSSPGYMLIYRRILIADVGISGLLGLGVMYELAEQLIAASSSLKSVSQHLSRWTMAVLLLVATGCSALISQGSIEQIGKLFQVVDFSSNLLKLGLLFALVVFSRVLRISWRSLPAGIALGFAFSAAAEMAAASLFSELGRNYYQRLDLVRMIAWHVCVSLWLIYIFQPSKLPNLTGHRLDRTELEAWDQELQKTF